MTPARRLLIWELAGRKCECGVLVPVAGTTFDHRIPFWTAPHLDDWPNLRPLCPACDKAKTAGKGGDLSRIAKTKRQGKMRLDVPVEPSKHPIKNRGFAPPPVSARNPTPAAGPASSGDGKRKIRGGKLPGKGQGRKLQSRNDLRRRPDKR